MKTPLTIDYVSDIHIDFHATWTNNLKKLEKKTKKFIRDKLDGKEEKGSILVIAGDIGHYNLQTKWVLEEFAKDYKLVYFLLGNHDYYLVSQSQEVKYKKNSMERFNELKEWFSNTNVHVMNQCKTIILNGWKIGFTNAWYPLETREQQEFFEEHNDSVCIHDMDIQMLYRTEKEWLEANKFDVLVTHVPIEVTERSKERTACYYAPISYHAKHVIFGHTHERLKVKKGNVSLYSNAWGYEEEEPFIIETLYL